MTLAKLYKEVLVCYDVEDDKKRKRLIDALQDHGLVRIQKSVFWGYLNQAERKAIRQAFTEHLNKDTDRAFVFPANLRKHLHDCAFGYTEETLPPLKTYEII